MKKFILKLDLHDDKEKRKALKTVSTLSGIDSITMNMKDKKLTVVGSVDPITVVSKLRKFWPTTDIMSVGPAKEPEKKEEPKKEEGKKEDGKEPKKEGGDGKDGPKKEEGKEGEKKPAPQEPVAPVFMPYRPYYPPVQPYRPYYQAHPNVIEPYKPLYQTHQPYAEPYKPYYNQARNHSIEESPNACVVS